MEDMEDDDADDALEVETDDGDSLCSRMKELHGKCNETGHLGQHPVVTGK